MPNDDLGQFPTPTTDTTTAPEANSVLDDINAPAPTEISSEPFTTPPVIAQETTPAPAFEETPDEIPSVISTSNPVEPPPAPPVAESQTIVMPEPPAPEPPPAQVEVPAVIVPKGGNAFGSLFIIILLLISGGAIAATVFLFSQSQQLKQQIQEITQTLEKQKTTITPTPTPTIIEFQLTPTPESTISATPTPVASISGEVALPLANATNALRVGINHLPNAQLILIKTENATRPAIASTKYFFRQDLTTKKYFYVLIENSKNPEIVDKSIYVTPDNNIPSLNDTIHSNALGIDLDQAVKIAVDLCTSGLCKTANVSAQYIKSGDSPIWQLNFDPADSTKGNLIIQINAVSKEILYKSAGF